MAALGRIWGVVNYSHPWLGYRDVDLDAATLRAIARVRASPTPQTLSAAVDEMLSALRDEATFVSRPCFPAAAAASDRSTRLLTDGVVYVAATSAVTPQTATLLRTARAAVVDLRPQPGSCRAPLLSHELVPLLVRGKLARADHRKVRHHGYKSQAANDTSSAYTAGFATVDLGAEEGGAEALTKVVFIVDERSAIPPVARDLAAAELATFVSAGRFPLHTAVDHCQISMPDHSIVTLRTSELVDDGGYAAEPAAMIRLAADAPESEVVAAAQQLARPRATSRRRASGVSAMRLGDYRWRADKTYADAQLPSPEQRILAAFRIWNVVHFFHGSREHLGDWDARFADIIATLEHADTRRDYELALAEVMALLPDGQAFASSEAWSAMRGAAAPPFTLLPVEGRPVVVRVLEGTESVKPGDELLRIDGQDVAARTSELARYTSAASPAAKQAAIVRDLAGGASGTKSTFTFRRPDGTQYDVALTRSVPAPAAAAKAWRIVDGNIAYVDLSVLESADVATMFNEIASTRALILDLRGETRPLHGELAQRIRRSDSVVGAMIAVPQLVGGASVYSARGEDVGQSFAPRYGGRTIALVDERTRGAAEHAALTFSALAETKLVGSSTAGSNGGTSMLVVPGNIAVRFTASEVRHPDGRRIDAGGLQPDTMITRTVRGVAEGRDEVLERAIRLVDEM